MVGSRKLARLLEHADQAQAKVVLVGDDRQLAPIDAGGGFRALRLRLGASELTENRRQHQAWEREALDLVRSGLVEEAVAAYQAHDRVVAADSKPAATLVLLQDWWTAYQDAEHDPSQELTLPRSYLDGRGHGERNRRVDLAYATTGHRAQGLTRGRALVRLSGTEDVNWLYVQLSRARQDTRLYAVVGPEPHSAEELDLPDREQPDGYLQLAQALSRAGGQTLAIDTPSSLDLQRLSTAELRAERDRLRQQLDQAPRDRSRELERATTHREQAGKALAAQ